MILSSLRFLDTFPISTDLSHMPNTPLNLGYTGEHVTHCGTKYARDKYEVKCVRVLHKERDKKQE